MIAASLCKEPVPKRVFHSSGRSFLTQFGVPNPLANPRLELHEASSAMG